MPQVTITIFDTTLRDGAQSLPMVNQFKPNSKPRIADMIASLGVGVIEAGFPATPTDSAEVAQVAKTVGNKAYHADQWSPQGMESSSEFTPVIAGLARAKTSDIDATWEAIKQARYPRIHTFVSTSDYHRTNKFPGVSRDELVQIAQEAVTHARQLADTKPGASVEFSAEAASTTDMAYLHQVIRVAIAAGADVINVPDTVGERDPIWMLDFYRSVIEWVVAQNPNVVISAHNHNDLGNAAANSFMLVRAASELAAKTKQDVAVQIEATIGGLGERAGNADVFTVMGNIQKFASDLPCSISWQFNPGKSVEVAQSIMAEANLVVDRQAPIVGKDTNVHRSGIHSDGVIKGGHSMYTPFDPTFWGHQHQAIHEDGKYEGKAGRRAATMSSPK